MEPEAGVAWGDVSRGFSAGTGADASGGRDGRAERGLATRRPSGRRLGTRGPVRAAIAAPRRADPSAGARGARGARPHPESYDAERA